MFWLNLWQLFHIGKPMDEVVTISLLGSLHAVVAVPKCSAAEIQLKKQQAIERRRQRLHAATTAT